MHIGPNREQVFDIFVSSSLTLEKQRATIFDAVRRLQAVDSLVHMDVTLCEDGTLSGWTVDGCNSQNLIDRNIREQCDFFIILVGDYVGQATVEEYKVARDAKIPVMIFMMAGATTNCQDAMPVGEFLDRIVHSYANEVHADTDADVDKKFEDRVWNCLLKAREHFLGRKLPIVARDDFSYGYLLGQNGQCYRANDNSYLERDETSNLIIGEERVFLFRGKSMNGKSHAAQRFVHDNEAFANKQVITITPVTALPGTTWFLNYIHGTKGIVYFIDDADMINTSVNSVIPDIINICDNAANDCYLVLTAREYDQSVFNFDNLRYGFRDIELKSLDKKKWESYNCKLRMLGHETDTVFHNAIGAIFKENQMRMQKSYRLAVAHPEKDIDIRLLVHAIKTMWLWKKKNRGDIRTLAEYYIFLCESRANRFNYSRIFDDREVKATMAAVAGQLKAMLPSGLVRSVQPMPEATTFECDDYVVEEIFTHELQGYDSAILEGYKAEGFNAYGVVVYEILSYLSVIASKSRYTSSEPVFEWLAFFNGVTKLIERVRVVDDSLPSATVVSQDKSLYFRMRQRIYECVCGVYEQVNKICINGNDEASGFSDVASGFKIVSVHDVFNPKLKFELCTAELDTSVNVIDRFFATVIAFLPDLDDAIRLYKDAEVFDAELGGRVRMAKELLRKGWSKAEGKVVDNAFLHELAAEIYNKIVGGTFCSRDALFPVPLFRYLSFDEALEVARNVVPEQQKATAPFVPMLMSPMSMVPMPFAEMSSEGLANKDYKVVLSYLFGRIATMDDFNEVIGLIKRKGYASGNAEIIRMIPFVVWNTISRQVPYKVLRQLLGWVNSIENDGNNELLRFYKIGANNVLMRALPFIDAFNLWETLGDNFDNYTCSGIIEKLEFEYSLYFFKERFLPKVAELDARPGASARFRISDVIYNILLGQAQTRSDLVEILRVMGVGDIKELHDGYSLGAVLGKTFMSKEVPGLLSANYRWLVDQAKGNNKVWPRPVEILYAVIENAPKDFAVRREILFEDISGDGVSRFGITREEQLALRKSPRMVSLVLACAASFDEAMGLLKDDRFGLYTEQYICHPDGNIINELLKNPTLFASYKAQVEFLERVACEFPSYRKSPHTTGILLGQIRYLYHKTKSSDVRMSLVDSANSLLKEYYGTLPPVSTEFFKSHTGANYFSRLKIAKRYDEYQRYVFYSEARGVMCEEMTPIGFLRLLLDHGLTCPSNKLLSFILDVICSDKKDVSQRDDVQDVCRDVLLMLAGAGIKFSWADFGKIVTRCPKVADIRWVCCTYEGFLKSLVYKLSQKSRSCNAITFDDAEKEIEEFNRCFPERKVLRTPAYWNAAFNNIADRQLASRKGCGGWHSNDATLDFLYGLIEKNNIALTAEIGMALLKLAGDIEQFDDILNANRLEELFPWSRLTYINERLKRMNSYTDMVDYVASLDVECNMHILNFIIRAAIRNDDYRNNPQALRMLWDEVSRGKLPLRFLSADGNFNARYAHLKPDTFTFNAFIGSVLRYKVDVVSAMNAQSPAVPIDIDVLRSVKKFNLSERWRDSLAEAWKALDNQQKKRIKQNAAGDSDLWSILYMMDRPSAR